MIIQHSRRMIKAYIKEIPKRGWLFSIHSYKLKDWKILRLVLLQNDPSGMVYKSNENDILCNSMMHLRDKHMFLFETLSNTLSRVEVCQLKTINNIKFVLDMLKRLINVHMVIIGMILKVIDEKK